MAQVTLSSKYQLVIPKDIRKQLHLQSGQKIQLIVKNGVITLIPDCSLDKLKGFLKGMDTSGIREDKERL